MIVSGKDVLMAADFLRSGDLVAVPTETVYGLAANALDEKAVLKIFEAKQRPFFDPLIVHIPDISEVTKYAVWSDVRLKKLAQKFWPGPLTILLPKNKVIPDLVTSGLSNVGLRVPAHDLTLQLLRATGFPLAAPSANPFGYVSPTSAQHVIKNLGDKISYVLDGGSTTVGLESTIVGVEEAQVIIYRLGGLSIEEIEKTIGTVRLELNVSSDPRSPGQLKNHYAPGKKLFAGNLDELILKNKDKKLALIGMAIPKDLSSKYTTFDLSLNNDLKEAAMNLFRCLREADESDAELVIAAYVENEGLGRAINDRLRRASSN